MVLIALHQWFYQLVETLSEIDQQFHLCLAALTIVVPLSVW